MKPARRCSIPGGAEPRPATSGRSRGMIDPGAGWIPRPLSIPMRPVAAASIARHCLRAIRQTETRPLVEALKTWLENRLAAVSEKSTIAEVIRYGFNHWQGLVRFLDDGRIEMDTNSVERAMRPIALNRRNSLFAGHDQGAVNWACIASLIETAKLHGIDPKPYLADILTKLVNGWPMAKIDELLPWAWAEQNKVSLAA